MHGAGHGASKAAAVVAGGHAPGVLRGVEVDAHGHLLGLQSEDVGHHLRAHGDVALPGRRRGDDDVQATQQVDADGGAGDGAVFRPGLGALLGRQHGADVAHVRHRGLDDGRHADAVQPPGRTRLRLALLQAFTQRRGLSEFGQARVVTGIEHRTRCRVVRELRGLHEVALAQGDGVHAQFDGDAVHQPFERVVHLRPAETAHQAGGGLARQHDAVAHGDVLDVVGPAQRAVHAVESGRLGGAQVGADIVALVPAQRGDAAVGLHRGFDVRQPRGGRGRRGQVFEPVLDPLHRRAAGLLRGQAHQHHIGQHGLLHAEAAAAVARQLVAQLVGRHAEGQRHHRMQAERAHEVAGDFIALAAGQAFGDDDSAFDGRAAVARVVHRQRDATVCRGEGGVGVAIAEAAIADDVAAHGLVQHGGASIAGGFDVHHRRQGLVVGAQQVERVFGDVAVLRHDHGHRFAGVPHLVDGQHVVLHGHLHADHEGLLPAQHVLPGQHRMHARQGQRRGRVHPQQPGMGMRAAQHRGVQRARRRAQVVAEAAAAGQQRGVFMARCGLAEVRLGQGLLQARVGVQERSPVCRSAVWRSLDSTGPAALTRSSGEDPDRPVADPIV